MSAARIVHRTAWRGSQSTRARWLKATTAAILAGHRAPRGFVTYHEHEVAAGRRDPKFQARKRFARAARGESVTSTDMHHFYGQDI